KAAAAKISSASLGSRTTWRFLSTTHSPGKVSPRLSLTWILPPETAAVAQSNINGWGWAGKPKAKAFEPKNAVVALVGTTKGRVLVRATPTNPASRARRI